MDTARRLTAMLAVLDQCSKDADRDDREDEYELLKALAGHVEHVLNSLAMAGCGRAA